MTKIRTHYDNLQVARTASDTVIRAAYRSLSQRYHPDKNPENIAAAERITKIINEAYAVLSDPVLRQQHDAWIVSQEAPPPPPPTSSQPRTEAPRRKPAEARPVAQAVEPRMFRPSQTARWGTVGFTAVIAFACAWAWLEPLGGGSWSGRGIFSTPGRYWQLLVMLCGPLVVLWCLRLTVGILKSDAVMVLRSSGVWLPGRGEFAWHEVTSCYCDPNDGAVILSGVRNGVHWSRRIPAAMFDCHPREVVAVISRHPLRRERA